MTTAETYLNEDTDVICEMHWEDIAVDILWTVWAGMAFRTFTPSKATYIRREWDSQGAGVIVVSYRQGVIRGIIDGRHRVYAARKVDPPVRHLHCLVLHDLTNQEEARLFRFYNASRGTPKKLEVFNARLIEQDSLALQIKRVTEAAGFVITKSRCLPGQTTAIAALEWIYKRGGAEALHDTLTILLQMWPESVDIGQAWVIKGMAEVLDRGGTHYFANDLRKKLAKIPLEQIVRNARAITQYEGASGYKAFLKAIAKLYNKGRRTRTLVI